MQAIDLDSARELEEKFDPEMRFRPLRHPAALIVAALLIVLSLLPLLHGGLRPAARDDAPRRAPRVRARPRLPRLPAAQVDARSARRSRVRSRPGGVPLVRLAAAPSRSRCRCSTSRTIFDDLAFRVGNPLHARRRDGHRSWSCCCSRRRGARWAGRCRSSRSSSCSTRSPGRSFPGLLKHSGASWPSLVNHLYLTSQGIYGIAVGVVATYVFHFVLFGVLATRIGLGPALHRHRLGDRRPLRGRAGQGVGVRARRCSACCRARRSPTR